MAKGQGLKNVVKLIYLNAVMFSVALLLKFEPNWTLL